MAARSSGQQAGYAKRPAGGTSAEHQIRQIRSMQHATRDAAQNPFDEAMAAIGSDRQTIGAERARRGQQRCADALGGLASSCAR